MTGYLRLEVRRMLRTPGFLVFTIAMPLVVYLVFSNLGTLTGQDKHDTALYMMVAIGGDGAGGAPPNYRAGGGGGPPPPRAGRWGGPPPPRARGGGAGGGAR